MPTLENNSVVFRFPQIDEWAQFSLGFQRTLRIPDTDRTYPLPPGRGSFQVRHVEDFTAKLPPATVARGGVILPMWQAEAMWLSFFDFSVSGEFPVAIKVAAGKINAVTGQPWRPGPRRNPQDYLVSSAQPWLDGFSIAPGIVRQFVAMPLGDGYTVEGQLAGEEEWGGLQIEATPLKVEAWRRIQQQRERQSEVMYSMAAPDSVACAMAPAAMGMAAGGRMRQEVYPDPFNLDDWDTSASDRVFVTLLHAKDWKSVTGEDVHELPPSAQDYARAGLPWFDLYGGDQAPLPGGELLAGIKSAAVLFEEKTGATLPHSHDVATENTIRVGRRPSRRPLSRGNW